MKVRPRPASTVLLVRNGEHGVEVFMEKRHVESVFVGGAYVFPGGRVDRADSVPENLCRGLTERQASQRLGLEDGGLAFYAAAIRECFEEAGILWAYTGGDLIGFVEPDEEAHYRSLRDQLNAGATTLRQIVEQDDLELATDRIHCWSHWITPRGEPYRYDTRFFIALAPERQTAAHDDWELTDSAWVTPGEAIKRALRREWMIILPTFRNLEQLAELRTAEGALDWARQERSFTPMVPRVLDNRILIPGDEGYDRALRDVSGVDPAIWNPPF